MRLSSPPALLPSLEMLFRGVTVDLLWGNTTIKQETERDSGEDDIAVLPHMRAGTGTASIASGYPAIAIQEELAGAVEGKKIKIEVTVPDLDEMELMIRLRSGEDEMSAELFEYVYKKDLAGELVPREDSAIVAESVMGDVSKGEGLYKISLEKDYQNSVVYEAVSLDVSFNNGRGGVNQKRDTFTLRF